jgi:hypothetical protein
LPRSGSGVYSQPTGTEAVSGEIASASAFNTLVDDIADEITESLTRSGTAAWSGNQDANNFTIENLATPSGSGDPATKGYVDGLTWSTKLKAIADLTWAADRIAYFTSASAAAIATLTSYGRTLIATADASAARTALALGSLATESTVDNNDWSGDDLALANGGTGASTAAAARTALEIVVYDLYTGTDVDSVSFPLGSYLMVDPGGTTPSRNSTFTVTLKAGGEVYEIAGAGSTVSGTWRARGVIAGSLLVQRTA